MHLMMVSIESRDVGDICGYVDGPLAPETQGENEIRIEIFHSLFNSFSISA